MKEVILTRGDIQKIDCKRDLTFKTNTNTQNIISKAVLLGDETEVIEIKDNLIALKISGKVHNRIIVITDAEELIIKDGRLLFQFTNFTSIDMTNTNTSRMKSTNKMFEMTGASEINIRAMDTSNVTDMSSMFFGVKIRELNINSLNTSNVTNMRAMFASANIYELHFDKIDTHNVTNMDQMFMGFKYGMVNFKLNTLDTSELKSMREMFRDCQIQRLHLKGFNTHNVLYMDFLFCGAKIRDLIMLPLDTTSVIDRTTIVFSTSDFRNFGDIRPDKDELSKLFPFLDFSNF